MTTAKRQGPRLTIAAECNDCEHLRTGLPATCTHGGTERPFFVPERKYRTPDWCPLMPKRTMIGPCAECKQSLATDRDDLLACKRVRTMTRGHMFVVRRDFGCIHWEQRP